MLSLSICLNHPSAGIEDGLLAGDVEKVGERSHLCIGNGDTIPAANHTESHGGGGN